MSTIPLGINVPTGYWDFSTGTNSFGSLVAAGLGHVPVWSQGAGHTPANEAQLEARTNVTEAFVRLNNPTCGQVGNADGQGYFNTVQPYIDQWVQAYNAGSIHHCVFIAGNELDIELGGNQWCSNATAIGQWFRNFRAAYRARYNLWITAPTPSSYETDFFWSVTNLVHDSDVLTAHAYWINYNANSYTNQITNPNTDGGAGFHASQRADYAGDTGKWVYVTEANSGPWPGWVRGQSTMDPNEACRWLSANRAQSAFANHVKGVSFFTAYDPDNHGSLADTPPGYNEQKIGTVQAQQIVTCAP